MITMYATVACLQICASDRATDTTCKHCMRLACSSLGMSTAHAGNCEGLTLNTTIRSVDSTVPASGLADAAADAAGLT